jgi:hypothetical protein
MNIQTDPAPRKWQKMLKKLQKSSMKAIAMQSRYQWDQLWSLSGDLHRKFEHVPHFWKVCSPTLDNDSMVTFSLPLYSLNLVPCDFTLFPKLNMKLKGRHSETCLTTKGNWKRYSTALRKNYSYSAFKERKNLWDFHMHSQGNYLEEITAKLCKLSQLFLFDLVQELSDST